MAMVVIAQIKQRLREMLPDVHTFLDVDDLTEGFGAEFVDVSSLTLIFCSKGYFVSKNCMREVCNQELCISRVMSCKAP